MNRYAFDFVYLVRHRWPFPEEVAYRYATPPATTDAFPPDEHRKRQTTGTRTDDLKERACYRRLTQKYNSERCLPAALVCVQNNVCLALLLAFTGAGLVGGAG